MDVLRGPTVTVRPFTDRDTDRLLAYRNDPETARYQGWDVPYSREEATRFTAWASGATLGVPGSWCQLGIERTDEPGLIGDIGIHSLMDEPTVVEVGVTLSPDHRRCGRASEAIRLVLDHLVAAHAVTRARALIVVDNAASIALFERLGFERTATRTADDGLDEHVYELALTDG